jgi:hypothetical protein
VTLGGAIWLWGATIILAALGLAVLFAVHGRWGVGLSILAGGAGFLFGVRWLARALERDGEP